MGCGRLRKPRPGGACEGTSDPCTPGAGRVLSPRENGAKRPPWYLVVCVRRGKGVSTFLSSIVAKYGNMKFTVFKCDLHHHPSLGLSIITRGEAGRSWSHPFYVLSSLFSTCPFVFVLVMATLSCQLVSLSYRSPVRPRAVLGHT